MLTTLAVLTSLLPAAPAATVGRISFPVSCRPAAQKAFTRGVSALHSFWYAEATSQFQAAEKADAKCAMAYWGEALSHIQLLWLDDDTEAARAALARMPAPPPTAREQAWLAAIQPLVTRDDPWPRRAAFAQRMEQMLREYPNDDEVKAFTALSLIVAKADFDLATYARAAALAMEVTAHNPDHPGALHYTIHALDTPELAPLALAAARRYAKIAPEAFHARHMPAHIFSRLGLWAEALASCESAFDASEKWVAREKLSPDKRDFHSLSWIVSINDELGRTAAAEKALAIMADAAKGQSGFVRHAYMRSLALHLRATGQWSRLEPMVAPMATAAVSASSTAGPACHGPATSGAPMADLFAFRLARARVEAAAARHDTAALTRALAGLAAARKKADPFFARMEGKEMWQRDQRQMVLEEAALRATAAGDDATAAARWREAAAIADFNPPGEGADELGGPHELAADAWLRAGKAKEAIVDFETSARQHVGHAGALLGLGRAWAKLGEVQKARGYFADAAKIWSSADADFAPAKEARDWLAAHPVAATR